MRSYAVISRLLDYPEQELLDHIDEMRGIVAEDELLVEAEREAIHGVLDWMAGRSLLDLQAEYVQTFDVVPEHTLYLTHHTFGDSRERGPALVELGEHYKATGVEADGELPDYLPLILEYCATLDPMEVQFFLGQAQEVLALVADNLDKAESPYAALVRIVEKRGRLARSAA